MKRYTIARYDIPSNPYNYVLLAEDVRAPEAISAIRGDATEAVAQARKTTGTIMVKDVSSEWVVSTQRLAVELRRQGWQVVAAADCESDIASPPRNIADDEPFTADQIRDACANSADIIRSNVNPNLPDTTVHDRQGATAVVLTNGSMSVSPPGVLGHWLSSMGGD